jgi:GT2 family glycosyltransferase
MPLPAHQLLDPACAIKPAWAVFDRGWYLHHHAEARAACAGQPDGMALIYYLRAGARFGHSPSPLFDETFYLARNIDIAELVRAGNYQSGFDHYCQHGHRGVSPHWLFDDELYGNLYDDMTLENLDQHRCYGRYDHYLKSGQRERRMGHFLFDGAFYRARAVNSGIPESEIDAEGPYVHFLNRLGGGKAELPPSIYFEPAWYLDQHAGAKMALERGIFASAIQHYLCSEAPEQLDPVPQFSEEFYRRTYPEIAKAVEDGFYRCAYQQFIQHGAFELRRPRADIDLMYYRDLNERVRTDLNLGQVRDAFAHLRLVGLKDNLPHCPPEPAPLITEPATKQQFLLRARNNLAIFARRRLDFSTTAPALSVVMVLFNKFDLTMLALASLRDNFAGEIELILVDNASTDDTVRIDQYVAGAKILRNTANAGFLRAANLALPHVSAPYLLYLNNDLELGHGAIAAALEKISGGDDIGAVGGKIFRTNGMLQEAGSIIWQDGTTTGYLRDSSPLAPEANFVRDVDYCSAVFLLCRTDLVKNLGGFDEDYAPAYYEEADLCVRMKQAGFRTVYDPAVVIQHYEFGSAAHSEASMALMRRGRRIFRQKHGEFLQTKLPQAPENLLRARAVSHRRKRILFIEDTIPLRRLGSGFVRANDIVQAISAAGYDVDIFPINGAPHDIMSLLGDLPDTAEILHDRNFMTLGRFLTERQGYYDLLWVSRTHNLKRILPILREAGILPDGPKMILDTEAVVTCRQAARRDMSRGTKPFDFDAALRAEFAEVELCHHVTAVNQAEVRLLKSIGLPAALLGTCRAPAPTPAPFAAREGLLFVAGIHETDSPNFDALNWYAAEILPALNAIMGTAPVLHVVGYAAPRIDLSPFAYHKQIKLHGPAGDLTPFYNQCRVFVAPTRFAAGTPYKAYETASFGLPCVATGLLAAQLGWQDGQELLAAPVNRPRQFAAQIAKLYESAALWEAVRTRALARLAAENNVAGFNKTVAEILRAALYNTRATQFAVAG